MLLDLSVFWRFFALNFIQLEVAESRCPMPHVFLDCYSRMFQHPLPNTGSYGTVREHLEVSYSMPCGLQHILHWTRPKRYLKTTMAWTQSCACITSAFRRRTCEENPQITTNATIQLIHRDLAEQVFKMYSGLTWSLLMISDRKLQSCHEPYVHPCQQSCRLESATKTRSQQHTLDVDKIDPIFEFLLVVHKKCVPPVLHHLAAYFPKWQPWRTCLKSRLESEQCSDGSSEIALN